MKLHNIASLCLSLFAGVALLTACDNETDFADPNNRDGKPLRIETSIAETRAVVTSTNFAEGDHIGLFVLDGDGKSYTENSMNQQVTYSNNTWVMQNDIVLSGNLSPYIYAFYPHFDVGDYITEPKDVKIPINLTPNLYNDVSGQADWMYANILLTQGNTAKLTFRHALARVTLQLKRGAEEQGDGYLSLVRMQNATKYNASTNEEMGKGKKLQTYGIMSLSDGTIETYGEENANIELATELVLSEDAQSIDILVIPTAPNGQLCTPDANTTGGGIEVLLTIDGKQYRVDLGVPTWHAGQQYIYPITINRNSAEVTLEPTEGAYIDLGLPSGTLWASCNVGAYFPEETGYFCAWGERDYWKDEYSLATYKWCNGTYNSMMKYCTNSDFGIVDNKTTLDLLDDAAYILLGNNWRMPTINECDELIKNCTWTWVTRSCNGEERTGYIVTGKNGNSIFIPAAGQYHGSDINMYAYYWSSTLYDKTNNRAQILNFSDKTICCSISSRNDGFPIRPVYDPQPELTPTEGAYINLGLPSGTLWASCNVGANFPSELGNHYAWGETETKDEYTMENYKYFDSETFEYISIGENISGTKYDAAYVNLGKNWRMPTDVECQELIDVCDIFYREYNGEWGYFIIGPNENCIFLPRETFWGDYWTGVSYSENSAKHLQIDLLPIGTLTSSNIASLNRVTGSIIRPIYDPQPTEPVAEAIDLGLSVKWASFNVGATKPEEYGGYYAWGETEEKEEYSTSTSLTYNLSYSELKSRGIIGEDGNLTASYDVAAIKWGGNWRMPTSVEIQELIEICTWTLTELNGINGYKVLGPNSNSIFLPAAGVFNPSRLNYVGEDGFYWSSTSNSDDCFAHGFHFYSENYGIKPNSWCNTGHSVRPVTK